jgi:hypothetical protein
LSLIGSHLRHGVNRKLRGVNEATRSARTFLKAGDAASGTAKLILSAIEIVVVGEDGGALESRKVRIEAEAIGEKAFAGQATCQARPGVDLPQTLTRPLDGRALLRISLDVRHNPGPTMEGG